MVARAKIPKEFEHLKDMIEETVNKEVEKIIERLEALRKAKGCLKTEKTWEELEAEIYEDLRGQ